MQRQSRFPFFMQSQIALSLSALLFSMAYSEVQAASNTPGRKMAEATIQSQSAKDEEKEKEEDETEAEKKGPADFKNRLSARRISEY
ncbi:MAG: hypothetical protein LW710_06455, partial [Burkholderiales bacterium]|uniref:hypothetical protein n=1 Tax=Limnobacter sp. TaxID=2003368 RepID=UPI0039BD1C18|nr:hypothetical protein [Burkholderiales bacterium]